MANIFHVERAANKVSIGTTGTTVYIGSHTASKILALDASKNLEVVTIGTSLDYARPTLNTIQDIRTTASPTFAGLNIVTNAAQALFNWTSTDSYGELAFKEGSTWMGFVGCYGSTYDGNASKQLIFTSGLNNDGGIQFRTRTDGSYYDRMQITNAGNVHVGGVSPKTKLTIEGTLTLKEQAAADGDTDTYGQLWVKSDTPNILMFTDDTGADFMVDVTAI